MKKLLAIAALLAFALPAAAQSPVGIASGQPTGTNYPMIQDIISVCSAPAAPITNVISNGSDENISLVASSRNVQYGIAQIEALIARSGEDPKMMSRIVMVFPFFSVEMHLIVGDKTNIKTLGDLAGKKVVEGPAGSGTYGTVQVIKHLTNVKWETYTLGQAAGLKAVQDGTVDAMFVVAGYPITMFKNPVLAKGYRFIPIEHQALSQFKYYTKTLIPTGEYPLLKSPLRTFKTDNALITFAYKHQYQKEIADLVTCLTSKVGYLQRHGHPKWKDVDPLDIERIQWPTHPAAVRAIKKQLQLQNGR